MSLLNNFKKIIGINEQAAAVPSQPAQQAQPVKKVLIVEDDQYLRDFYAELLKGAGFDVITAVNGQLGLEALQSQKPKLVILDLMMPVMDGKTMLKELRKIPEFEKLPVIILTNAGTTENMKDTKFYGNANEFLIKANVTPEELLEKVTLYCKN